MLFYVVSFFRVAGNVVALGDGGVKNYFSSNFVPKIIESSIAETSKKAPLAPNACYV